MHCRSSSRAETAALSISTAAAASSRPARICSSWSCHSVRRPSLDYDFGMQQVLVLNASFEPLNVCTVRRAHVLVFKGKAEVLEELDHQLHSASDTYPWPCHPPLGLRSCPAAVKRKISRRALFARDGHRCVYCGSAGGLTLDHVVPRSRGGDSVWENVVTSCAPCNLRKGNRLPEELEMRLLVTARPHAGPLRHAVVAPDPRGLAAVPFGVRLSFSTEEGSPNPPTRRSRARTRPGAA